MQDYMRDERRGEKIGKKSNKEKKEKEGGKRRAGRTKGQMGERKKEHIERTNGGQENTKKKINKEIKYKKTMAKWRENNDKRVNTEMS